MKNNNHPYPTDGMVRPDPLGIRAAGARIAFKKAQLIVRTKGAGVSGAEHMAAVKFMLDLKGSR